MSEIQALAPLRHACLGCGGSCRGVNVPLVGEDEIGRMVVLAYGLGIDNPIVDGALRLQDGACVFLDADARCRLHTRWGPEAKPRVCRQYPTVVVHTEAGARSGIDPGCYTAWKTWRTGPEVDVEAFVGAEATLDERQARYEAGLLGVTGQPGATIARLLEAMCPGKVDDTGLPPGLAARMVERVQAADVPGLVARPEAGASFRAALAPLAASVGTWRADAPPVWRGLPAESEAWAVEVVRRTLHLRLSSRIPYVQGVALLVATGAVVCGWADARPEAFGPALAAWSRALRMPAFWRALTPDPAALLWLATGARPT